MTKNKSKLILDTDYYSAYETIEGETEDRVSIVKIMKLLIPIVIIGTLVLVSTYYVKNNFTKISTWLTNKKEFLFPEMKEVIIIREEISVSKKVEKIVPVIKINKETPIVVAPTVVKSNDLSDEYIKLMQESLGKY